MTVDQVSFFVWLIVMFYAAIFSIYDCKCYLHGKNKLNDAFDKLMDSIK